MGSCTVVQGTVRWSESVCTEEQLGENVMLTQTQGRHQRKRVSLSAQTPTGELESQQKKFTTTCRRKLPTKARSIEKLNSPVRNNFWYLVGSTHARRNCLHQC